MQEICFTPTSFNTDNHIELDFFYDESAAWQGRIIEIFDPNTGNVCKKVKNLQSLNPDTWFTISNGEGFDVNSLMVGDSIQFRLKGGCELPGKLGGNNKK